MKQSNEQIRTAAAQTAAEWFVTNEQGLADETERQEFMAWLRLSPQHVEEYLAIAAISKRLPAIATACEATPDELIAAARREGGAVASIHAQRGLRERAASGGGAVWLRTLAVPVALAASVLVGVAALWTERGNWLGAPLSYRTAHGERRSWPLPDGSAITLNADSALEIRFTLAGRSAEVTRGRALFQVAHERSRAFRVTAGPASVVAVGTRFDVERLAAATLVTVAEGKVIVSATDHGDAAAGAGAGAAARSIAVGRGEQVRVEPHGGPLHAAPVDVQAAGAWLRGQIVFEQRPLGEVADEFNRYAPVPFDIADPTLRRLPISGVFGDDDADSFEQFLKSLDDVSVERSSGRVRVTRRAAPAPAPADARR